MAKQPKPRPGHEGGHPGSGAPQTPHGSQPKPIRVPVKK